MADEVRELSYAQAIQEALAIAMERDERVFLMGEEVDLLFEKGDESTAALEKKLLSDNQEMVTDVATRVGVESVAKLEQAMPELKQALDILEELSGASGEGLLGKVGEVTDKIEEITKIVEQIRPILDAAEALM